MTNFDDQEYYKVLSTIERLGFEMIESKQFLGNEIILDAGCGSGKYSKILSDKVPHGHVFAVDSDQNRIREAKNNLAGLENVTVIEEDLIQIDLPQKVDVIFSNMVLHHIADHHKILKHFWSLLKKDGNMLIQCAGYGNLAKVSGVITKVAKSKPFEECFIDWKEPWYFAKPDSTKNLLEKIGYKDITVYLKERPIEFSNRSSYAKYLVTIIFQPLFNHISDTMKKEAFITAVLDEFEKKNQDLMWKLDHVWLTVFANK